MGGDGFCADEQGADATRRLKRMVTATGAVLSFMAGLPKMVVVKNEQVRFSEFPVYSRHPGCQVHRDGIPHLAFCESSLQSRKQALRIFACDCAKVGGRESALIQAVDGYCGRHIREVGPE